MRVLVACEFSGVVREAFCALGHDAWSCDLRPALPLSDRQGRHIQGDVRPLLKQPWDLVIAHPPCTYLTHTGVKYLGRPGRRADMREACRLFLDCLAANSPRICVENPPMHREARAVIGPATQFIQPWEFGHAESKRTGLWLRGLPPLRPTIVCPFWVSCRDKEIGRPRSTRKVWRSITYYGIAEAMAAQWGTVPPTSHTNGRTPRSAPRT